MAKGRKTGGRQAGTPNKLTADIREAWLEAVAYANGTKGATLRDFARAHPEKFWPATLQLLPKNVELSGKVGLIQLLAESHKDGE